MKLKKLTPTFASAFILAAASLVPATAQAQNKDIIDTAVAAKDFTILAKALQAADLVDALKGDGPYTVFAPTDAAFKRLPKGTIETLLKPENKLLLINTLTYHVVKGNVAGSKAVTLSEAKALNNDKIKVSFKNAALYINQARVIATDIKAKNGVIHVIDNVILPPSNAKIEAKIKAAAKAKQQAIAEEKAKEAAMAAKKATAKNNEKSKKVKSKKASKPNADAHADAVATAKDKSNVENTECDAKGHCSKVAISIIEESINNGVDLFNAGNEKACASVYKVAAMSVLEIKPSSLEESDLAALSTALKTASDSKDNSQNSWLLRKALDKAYKSMKK